jgi:FkbM family methyltransferase
MRLPGSDYDLAPADYRGYRLLVMTHGSDVSDIVRAGGEIEPEVAAVFRRTVRPGMVVVDAGANLGVHTILLADLVGPSGRVIAFEPNRHLTPVLAHNVAANGFADRVTIHPAGCARTSGGVPFFESDRNVGESSVCFPHWHEYRVSEVEVIPLDDAVRGQVDFIKLDVEGAEYDVLAGGTEILATHRPMIVLELGHCREVADLLRLLAPLRYEYYTTGGEPLAAAAVCESTGGPVFNIVCQPAGRR